MAFKITDACVKCGSCADQCPVEAISEGDELYVIDADVCVSCGACADQCPVSAIEEEYSSQRYRPAQTCAGRFCLIRRFFPWNFFRTA